MNADRICRVLSIQSHVVRGYVGNRSAVFPLQLLGFEVDFINSVQFSNHTGYPHWNGTVLSCADFEVLYDTLTLNDVVHYDYVLTGYCRDKEMLRKVVKIIKELKQKNPNLLYVCDPVMGDTWDGTGKMYVPEELLPVYKDEVLPIADIISPNQFEAQLLTGTTINNEEDALRAINSLHLLGPSTIVLSSMSFPDKSLMGYGSQKSKTNGNDLLQVRVEIPFIDAAFVGSGDLFTALLLAWTYRHPDNLQLALEKVISTMQYVLKKTADSARAAVGPGKEPTFADLELRLIQCKKEIEDPVTCVKTSLIKSPTPS